tara:strand:- start:49 stop:186 length:138 start_codon:yes stop_codon:yes gene_type:complete
MSTTTVYLVLQQGGNASEQYTGVDWAALRTQLTELIEAIYEDGDY